MMFLMCVCVCALRQRWLLEMCMLLVVQHSSKGAQGPQACLCPLRMDAGQFIQGFCFYVISIVLWLIISRSINHKHFPCNTTQPACSLSTTLMKQLCMKSEAYTDLVVLCATTNPPLAAVNKQQPLTKPSG